ncbi:MAG: ATP-binding protein [Desulfocapsaceae bacterium]
MGHRDYRKPGDLQVHIFQDRVEIVNPGGLVGGLTLETLGTRSIPRNPLLFGMMHRMNLVEKVGSGLLRIRQMCEAYPCPPPRIEADADWYRIIFSRYGTENSAVLEQDGTKLALSRHQVEILHNCREEKAIPELMELSKRTDRTKFRNQVLRPLLDAGFIEMTIPDKPQSSKQKYRLTEEGKRFLQKKR